MSTKDSFTRQQLSMIMSSLLQSLRIACTFIVFPVSESQTSIITAHCSHSTVASVRSIASVLC